MYKFTIPMGTGVSKNPPLPDGFWEVSDGGLDSDYKFKVFEAVIHALNTFAVPGKCLGSFTGLLARVIKRGADFEFVSVDDEVKSAATALCVRLGSCVPPCTVFLAFDVDEFGHGAVLEAVTKCLEQGIAEVQAPKSLRPHECTVYCPLRRLSCIFNDVVRRLRRCENRNVLHNKSDGCKEFYGRFRRVYTQSWMILASWYVSAPSSRKDHGAAHSALEDILSRSMDSRVFIFHSYRPLLLNLIRHGIWEAIPQFCALPNCVPTSLEVMTVCKVMLARSYWAMRYGVNAELTQPVSVFQGSPVGYGALAVAMCKTFMGLDTSFAQFVSTWWLAVSSDVQRAPEVYHALHYVFRVALAAPYNSELVPLLSIEEVVSSGAALSSQLARGVLEKFTDGHPACFANIISQAQHEIGVGAAYTGRWSRLRSDWCAAVARVALGHRAPIHDSCVQPFTYWNRREGYY